MPSKYIFYALRATEEELKSKSTGTTFEAVRGDDLRSHSIFLPPLPEQRRIVAEIGKQFTRLDASVAALKRAQANLKRYRASVLKAACEGELVPTEAELARAKGRDYEPASQLLERILIERRARWECDVHTLLRLPTGVFYAQGVKANVLFFDRKPASESPWTQDLWIYDLRTNQHFTLKTNPLARSHLDDFVTCYNLENRRERQETERFHRFSYDDLMTRDKANLDIFWLRDESMEDSSTLPPPDIIAEEIVEDLRAALEQMEEIAEDLSPDVALVQNSDGLSE